MIKRFRELDKYQKGMIIVMAAMAVIFAVLTVKTVSKKGFNYRGTILTKTEENGSTVYSGTRKGMATSFTIGPDSGIVYRFGDKKYGPYYVKIDNSLLEPGISPNDETVAVLYHRIIVYRLSRKAVKSFKLHIFPAF